MIGRVWIECLAAGWHPSGMRVVFVTLTGDVASLNHRLMAGIPRGSLAIEIFTSLKMPLKIRLKNIMKWLLLPAANLVDFRESLRLQWRLRRKRVNM